MSRKKLLVCLFLLATIFCGSFNVWGSDDVFSVATLNVDGLPSKILFIDSNPDGPGTSGTNAISRYLCDKGYDIIGVQEDFNYDWELHSFLDAEYDCGMWQGDISFSGLSWLIWNTKFETDGLRVFWRKEHTLEHEEAVAWYDSYGRTSNCWDDMVTKGFRRCEMTLAGGQRIVVYNMHMDASTSHDEANGDDGGDRDARRSQWRQLCAYVLERLDERPILLIGDMNSLYSRDEIQTLFIDPINATGHHRVYDAWVEDSRQGVFPPYTGQDRFAAFAMGETFDKILYILPTSGQRLEQLSYKLENSDYVGDDGTPLGDHFPVSALFKFVETPPSSIVHPMAEQEEIIYDVSGRQHSSLKKGLRIKKTKEGRIRKVIIFGLR